MGVLPGPSAEENGTISGCAHGPGSYGLGMKN